jgi:hypothetical protein
MSIPSNPLATKKQPKKKPLFYGLLSVQWPISIEHLRYDRKTNGMGSDGYYRMNLNQSINQLVS